MPTIRIWSLIGVLLLTGIIACGGPKYNFGKAEDEPDWITKPERDDGIIYAVGISPPGLTRKVARLQSEIDATSRLAREIESRTKQRAAQSVNSLQDSETYGADAAGIGAKSEDMTKAVVEITTKTAITGAYAQEYWTNPENGEAYCLMRIDTESVDLIAKSQLFNRVRDEMNYVDEKITKDLREFLDEAFDE